MIIKYFHVNNLEETTNMIIKKSNIKYIEYK